MTSIVIRGVEAVTPIVCKSVSKGISKGSSKGISKGSSRGISKGLHCNMRSACLRTAFG